MLTYCKLLINCSPTCNKATTWFFEYSCNCQSEAGVYTKRCFVCCTRQHIFIPLLPPHLIDYCTAPMPYVIGLHASLLKVWPSHCTTSATDVVNPSYCSCCCRSCVRTNLVTRSFSMLTRVRFCRSTTTCHAFRTTSYVDHLVIQQPTTLVIPRSVAGVELAEAPARRQVRQEHECHGWRWTGSSLPQGDGLPHWYD